MVQLLITYSVTDNFAAKNKKFIREFIKELSKYSVEGLQHNVFRFGKSSFIHVCLYATPQQCEFATTRPAFRSFLTTLQKNVANDPLTYAIEQIGQYP
jgi:hypothetical protein